jgi:hypothetical protein
VEQFLPCEDMPPALVDLLKDRRRRGRDIDGPARLLRKLVKRGLAERHLLAGAQLVLALDEEACRR